MHSTHVIESHAHVFKHGVGPLGHYFTLLCSDILLNTLGRNVKIELNCVAGCKFFNSCFAIFKNKIVGRKKVVNDQSMIYA